MSKRTERDDYDEQCGLRWQLSLRDKKGAQGTAKQPLFQSSGKSSLAMKIQQADPYKRLSKGAPRAYMLQEPAMTQKNGERNDEVFISSEVLEIHE